MRFAERLLQPARPALLAALGTLALTGLIPAAAGGRALAGTRAGAPAAAEAQSLGDAVSPSTPEQLALVEHLRLKGAVFYGAWWCPHCFHQKNLFGTEAGRRLPYVECYAGETPLERCTAAEIRAFPTWDLNGERREGVLTLEELKLWSGFSPKPAP
ncbi:MAG: hypothetical protein ACO3FA_04605 [Vulcanococcus sp.]|jgi:hypothetical protein